MEEILHQLRLVFYPIFFGVLYIPGGAGFRNHQQYWYDKARCWFLKIYPFREMIQFWLLFLQMGWNHQLESYQTFSKSRSWSWNGAFLEFQDWKSQDVLQISLIRRYFSRWVHCCSFQSLFPGRTLSTSGASRSGVEHQNKWRQRVMESRTTFGKSVRWYAQIHHHVWCIYTYIWTVWGGNC